MAGRNGFWSRLIGRAPREGAAMPERVREQQRASEQTIPQADPSRFEPPSYEPELARQVPDEELIEWLATKGPREWHSSAVDWNWDKGLGPLIWILRQPGCDRGTAICIFARGEPDIFSKYESVEELRAKEGYYPEQAEMLIELCERWAAGQYQDYRFDPEDVVRGVRPELMPWPVPEDLVRAERQGETLDHIHWEEGVPAELIYGPPPSQRSGG